MHDKVDSSTLIWISQRNVENWVIANSKLIEKLKETPGTRIEVFNFFKSQGYDTAPSIRRVLKKGVEYGVLHSKSISPGHYVNIELTDLGLELYKKMCQEGDIK